MQKSVTKEQANLALQQLAREHANEAYFKKIEVGSNEGYVVDLYVDRAKWELAGKTVPSRLDRVPVCVLLVG
jgi:hypothetical protein